MANKILNLIFKATDKASPVIDDIKGATGDKGVGGITAALEGLVGPATLAAAGLTFVGVAVADMMADWREHIIGIGDFAAVLGISTEEASALNEIAGAFNITQGNMLTVMENLVKEGLDPTIEGLIEAKDLIFASKDPTEQLTTAIDLLGKKGAEDLLPMFRDMGDELENYEDNMGDAVIVTDEMYQAAMAQQEAVDTMKGAWHSFSMGIAGTFAPAITSLIEVLNELFFVQERSISQFIRWRIEEGKTRNTYSDERQYTLPRTSGGGGGGGGSGSWQRSERIEQPGFQHGGEFTIGGFGGPDSTRVSFMGTPGEDVKIGGGSSDMAAILAEVKRLVDILPVLFTDAVERVM